jgi:hypothetical protein
MKLILLVGISGMNLTKELVKVVVKASTGAGPMLKPSQWNIHVRYATRAAGFREE